jgi:hypothetical protein
MTLILTEVEKNGLTEKKEEFQLVESGARGPRGIGVNNVSSIFSLISIQSPIDSTIYNVSGFYADPLTLKGGGVYKFVAATDKATANGGTIIDPDNVGAWDGTVSTLNAEYYGQNGQGSGVGAGCWERVDSGEQIGPEMFGALGDGLVIDTEAVKRRITAAGVNGEVFLSPSAVYVIDAVLEPLQGQIWTGYGATLKRVDKFATTFSAPLSSGSTNPTISVVDASGFRVGQDITFYKTTWTGSTETANQEQFNFTISAISGNDISLTGGTTVNSYVIGDNVITSTMLISKNGSTDVTVIGIEFDGNRSSYAGTFNFWVNHAEIRMTDNRTTYRELYAHDSLCEAFYIGGDGSQIINCRAVNTGGNGVHISTGFGGLIDGCYFESNSLGTSTEHQNGAISLSLDVDNWNISNCSCDGKNLTPAFIGGNNETTKNITVSKCMIKDLTGNAIDFLVGLEGNQQGVSILDCYLDNAGDIEISNTVNPHRINNVKVSGNTIINGGIALQRISASDVSNNIIDRTGDAAFQCINLNIVEDSTVFGNKTIEGNSGVACNGGGCLRVTIKGNTIENPHIRGVALLGLSDSGSVVDGNTIIGVNGVTTGFTGILTREANSVITNNTMNSDQTSVIPFDLSADADGSDVIGNMMAFVGFAPQVRAGCTNANLINNTVSIATNDAGTGTNIVNENVLI